MRRRAIGEQVCRKGKQRAQKIQPDKNRDLKRKRDDTAIARTCTISLDRIGERNNLSSKLIQSNNVWHTCCVWRRQWSRRKQRWWPEKSDATLFFLCLSLSVSSGRSLAHYVIISLLLPLKRLFCGMTKASRLALFRSAPCVLWACTQSLSLDKNWGAVSHGW